MINVNQQDYSHIKIPPTDLTIGTDGCLVSVVGSIVDMKPDEVIKKLSFTDQGWLYLYSCRNIELE